MPLPAVLLYNITTGVEQYAKPGYLIIASFYTVGKPEVQAARAAGAIVLLYTDPAELVLKPSTDPGLAAYYDPKTALMWPYPCANGARSIWPGNVLADVREGSPWADHVVNDAVNRMAGNPNYDGLFLDVIAGRLWTAADWDNWPADQKQAWSNGTSKIVQRINAARRLLKPNFRIINNNLPWFDPAAETSVDGVSIEHHTPQPGSANWVYASRPFSGNNRTVLIITKTAADAQGWKPCPGVTHIACQPDYTSGAPAPAV